MGLHEKLHKQLLEIIEKQEKHITIKILADKVEDICNKLRKENETIIKRGDNFENLTVEEESRIKELNDLYYENMRQLNRLILDK